MSQRWYGTLGIIKSAGSYVFLLPEVSRALYKFSQSLPGDNINVRNSRLCVEKVVQTRQVDYDLYRIPAMKASAEFKDLKIEPYELLLGTKKGSSTAVLDLDAVAADKNLSPAVFQKKVDDCEDNVFPKDPIYGQKAKGHRIPSGHPKRPSIWLIQEHVRRTLRPLPLLNVWVLEWK